MLNLDVHLLKMETKLELSEIRQREDGTFEKVYEKVTSEVKVINTESLKAEHTSQVKRIDELEAQKEKLQEQIEGIETDLEIVEGTLVSYDLIEEEDRYFQEDGVSPSEDEDSEYEEDSERI